MKVELKGKKLIIEIDAETENPKASSTGKSLMIASSEGPAKTGVMVKGKEIVVSLNAYISNKS